MQYVPTIHDTTFVGGNNIETDGAKIGQNLSIQSARRETMINSSPNTNFTHHLLLSIFVRAVRENRCS